ncbi:MAG: sigma-70 family RNA polymerase sigma factor [Saccharothrix sp.]|nr:sigma-70 family RNA polymerase sigma factor [Saccharothrix sp.]
MIEQVFREQWSRVLASLVGFLGDFDLAEEAAQEAFAVAAERWPRDGTPANPVAWLITTGRNRAIDRLRRERTFAAKAPLLATPQTGGEPEMHETTIPDERLELIFTCCHPALAVEAQVALTLRALGGLSTEEIAHAFLTSPETMKRRLTRAKTKIKTAGIPFRVPTDHLLPERLAVVLKVLYLIFNEGYGASGRDELRTEAIRLGRVLAALMPDEPEALGLLALMLCHHARSASRRSGDDIVLLEDQDRTLWDTAMIGESRALLDRAIARARGPYTLQAAIAVLQTEPDIDWTQIASLYGELTRMTGSPVVELNRAVAVAQAGAPEAALRITERLDLDDYPYLHSTRAELLRRLDRADEAEAAYRRALALTDAGPERRFIAQRIAELQRRHDTCSE